MRLTDPDWPLALRTVNTDVCVHAARNKRIVGKLCASSPNIFLFWRRPETEGIVTYFILLRCHLRQNLCSDAFARTTRLRGFSFKFRKERRSGNLSQSSAYHLHSGQRNGTYNESNGSGLHWIKHVSMPNDPDVNRGEYEKVSRGVQTCNPTFEPAVISEPLDGRSRPRRTSPRPTRGTISISSPVRVRLPEEGSSAQAEDPSLGPRPSLS